MSNNYDRRALLDKGPEAALAFARQVWAGEIPLEGNLKDSNWWSRLAYAATGRAIVNALDPKAIQPEWARLAIAIYEYLARSSKTAEYKLVVFKARLLWSAQKLDIKLEPSLATVEELVTWFLDGTERSYDEIVDMLPFDIEALKLIPPEESGPQRDTLKELRDIKNRLGVLQVLESHGLLNDDQAEAQMWLALRPKLP